MSGGIFDGLPLPADKEYLRDGLSRIDEGWAAARFDSLPHVVHILTSKDREGEVQFLREQSDLVEDVVDEVVHAYHHGFNKAIQNYSQILRLFSESADSISVLKVDMAEAKKLLGSRNKQLKSLWYRSLTLRHVLSLLDQIESVAKVPARIEKLTEDGQLYAAVQLLVQSALVLEREGLQVVGALQDIRSELSKLRGVLFFKVLEDLHSHLYNKGLYSSASLLPERDDDVPTTASTTYLGNGSQPISRRTRSMKVDNRFGGSSFGDGLLRRGSVDGSSSFDGHDEENSQEITDGTAHAGDGLRSVSRQLPVWLSNATPDEFIESMKKSDAPMNVKYLRTLVECLHMLGKVAAAGAIICQRLRPTIHEIIISRIKTHATHVSSRSHRDQGTRSSTSDLIEAKGLLQNFQIFREKGKSGTSNLGAQLAVSPVPSALTPMGTAQSAASELLRSTLDLVIHILENHIAIGELLESKLSQQADVANTPKSMNGDTGWNPDSESSQATGGFSIGFSLSVMQSECQQLICEILRATPESTTADAAVQTARLANKAPAKEKRDGSEGLSFAFRFTDTTLSVPNQVGQGWRKGSNQQQEGYGTTAVLPEQGIYLAASIYRPVLEFTDKITSMLPQKYLQPGNDGLLSFVENYLKDHFLPGMFVDYRKCVQQALSSSAAFRPRTQGSSVYSPLLERGRPVLQGLLATDMLCKEVLGWAQLMPKYACELVEYVQAFLERAYERCRTSFTEAVLEKQSYMLIGRNDVENLMQLDPANAYLQNSSFFEEDVPDSEPSEAEKEMSDLLLSLRPIKQEHLIRDDNKLIMLASLSDSLEYLADCIERLGESFVKPQAHPEEMAHIYRPPRHSRTQSALTKNLATLSDDYRRLAGDCLKVLRLEMQLETIFHMQEMTNREYLEDQDAEEPDDFVISLTTKIMRRDEEMAPFVADLKRNYIFGGICSAAADTSIKALAEMRSINLLGVQQICRNSIALGQALAAIPSIDSEAVQHRLDRVRTYYELLNLPFEALLAFIAEHEHLFTLKEYSSLVKIMVPGREIPDDAQQRVSEILKH